MYRLEDINENVTTMVTIIKLTQYKGTRQLQNRNLFLCPNGLTDFNEIWNQDILGDDASFE